MAGFWPLYSNFSSKAQVTLALPGIPSAISKSIGMTSSALLLVPNVDFIISFMEGNLGIADSIVKSAMVKNLNSPIASNDEMVVRQFSKVNKLGIEDKIANYKDESGKIKIPKSEISSSTENDSLGLKAMEKTILQSIFETQKPYMEIAKMVIDVLVDIEDIIARVMPLLSISPLTFKSDKPISNGGSGNRPKAIGYQGGAEIKKAMADLNRLSKIGGKMTVNKDGTISKVDNTKESNNGSSDFSDKQNEKLNENGLKYKIVDVVYSTGFYDPTVDYIYSYIDLPSDDDINSNQADETEDDVDPYDKYKPKRIILGIFDSKGVPIDPKSKLKTIGLSGPVETPFEKASWITKSSKWVFPKSSNPNAIVWPSFGTPIYTWERLGGINKVNSKTQPESKSPAPPFTLKKYKKGDKNILNGFDAIEGDPVISGFEDADVNTYSTYLKEYTKVNMDMSKDLTDVEKKEYVDTIMSQVNVLSHLENVNTYGQNKVSVYKDFNVPDNMKFSFKPMQITIPEALNDPKLVDGKIWIDPESDYETKIIQVKVASKIEYFESRDESNVQVDIKSFIKNKAVFKLSDNTNFNIDITKNGSLFESFVGVNSYTLENWNYEPDTKKILPNSYSINIWSEKPGGLMADILKSTNSLEMGSGTPYFKHGNYSIVINSINNGKYSYSDSLNSGDGLKIIGDGSLVEVKSGIIIKWYYVYNKSYNTLNLPKFGKEITISYNLKNTLKKPLNVNGINYYYDPISSTSDKTIPLYQLKVTNGDFPYGKIIDPSKILNEHLTKDELYSKGMYGVGSPDSLQELGTIYRYSLTDLDEETYYIIEGVKVDENNQNGPGESSGAGSNSGGGTYRLPHAVGSISVFIKMIVKVFSKLIPSIVKLLKLFGNPMSFVTDIIMEKLGESFSTFSPEAKKTFESANDLKKDKERFSGSTPNNPKMGDYVNKMKGIFEGSQLKNHIMVDSIGNLKDSSGKVPSKPPKDVIGNFKFVADGVGFIPFSIFGKDLSFGMELKMDNIITKEWGNPSPMRLIFNKEKVSKDDGLNVSGPTKDDGNNENSKNSAKNEIDVNSKNNSGLKQGNSGSIDPNKRYTTISTWYSTGQFINGVDYKFIYINQSNEEMFKEVDELSNSLDPEDLKTAKEKLERALDKNPNDESIKNKLDEIKKKNFELNSNSQPLLKISLGIVTLPIKIIAGIVEWIMDFFKSLTNPMALPGKIIEFLSFKWILDFVTPIGILKMMGIKIDPSMPLEWLAKANIPNPDKSKSKRDYLYEDDFELADFTKFFSVPFLGQLPTYTTNDIRDQGGNIPKRVFSPIICFIEKLINGIIDFIWATLGIECIIPPPHIKLCSGDNPDTMDPEVLGKILNGEDPKSTSTYNVDFKSQVVATDPVLDIKSPVEDLFIYEIALSDGTVLKIQNKEELDKFIQDNKNIGFDFQF